MNWGGTLLSDPLFKNILSIGYEFETHDFSKLSLHENNKTMINSNLTLRKLQDKIDLKSISVVDANYLRVRIPIAKKQQEQKGGEGSLDMNEEDFEIDEEEAERLFLEHMKEEHADELELEEKQKEVAARENDSYLEYFNENRPGDNKSTDKAKIKFNIINDMGDNDFSDMVKELCKDRTLPKNEMYYFKTNKGKLYDIKFSEEIADNKYCESFSGVEYVVTYYNPKRENQNIIVDTFVDACSRVIDHLGNLQKIKGTLFLLDDDRKMYTPIGVIENERCLYHKPNTNLYYMDTYDYHETLKLQSLKRSEFVPQMTFRCMANYAINIMIEICKNNPKFTRNREMIDLMEGEHEIIITIEQIVDNLFATYNQTADKKIERTSVFYETLKCYIFLIFYKLYMFIHYHGYIFNEDMYLKDYLTFSSRHANIDLYSRVKEILRDNYGISTTEEVQKLFLQDTVLHLLYQREIDEDDPEEQKMNALFALLMILAFAVEIEGLLIELAPGRGVCG
jgi:hypothetical protein